MIIIKSLTNQVSVNHLNPSLRDVIRAPSLLCSLSNGSVYKGGDLFQHPSSTATSVDLCIYPVTSCFELSGPSNDITHSSNFRTRPLSLNLSLSHANWHTKHIHSLAAFNWSPWWSLLAAFHLSISELMHVAMCKWLYMHALAYKHTQRFVVCYLPSQQDQ